MENKQLQEEAEEYCKLVPEVITKKMTLDECIAIVNEFVINSKYVEQEKLKFAIEQIKDVIFKSRIFKSDWLDEFYSLDEEAANPDYNPCFKYTEEEILESLEQQLKELEK